MFRFDADGVVTTFVTAEGIVNHLERDKFASNNIIFSDRHALKTTDGTDTYNIAGIATQPSYVGGCGHRGYVQLYPLISPTSYKPGSNHRL